MGKPLPPADIDSNPQISSVRTKRSSAVTTAVTALRQQILSQEDGTYLGSEDQLLSTLGISRPTLRQAVRLLEHECLLVIKRGAGGGFYVRRPQIEAVAHAAAIYLWIEQATPQHIFSASIPLLGEAIRIAATCQDEKLRARLAKLLIKTNGSAKSDDDATAREIEFAKIIGEMCGNPAIQLFISILYQFGVSQWREILRAQYRGNAGELHDIRDQVIRAVLANDPELAFLYSQRRSSKIIHWMFNELPREPSTRVFGAPSPGSPSQSGTKAHPG